MHELPRERQYEIGADVMLRIETGRNDGCHVGLWNLPNGMIRVYLFSPHESAEYEGVTGDEIPATELVQWLMNHRDY